MSKKEIFEYFYTNNANLSIESLLMTLLAGLLISAIICFTYKLSYQGVAYNNKFCLTTIVTNLIAIVIMLMISSNVVISLGMVGALSIVRFRTAIKDSRDTVFLFWAISEGLSTGSGNFQLAIFTTVFIAIIIMGFSFISKVKGKYLLIIRSGKEGINMDEVGTTLMNYVKKYKVRTISKSETHSEAIIEVGTSKELDTTIIEELSKIKGIKTVNYISESGESLGE